MAEGRRIAMITSKLELQPLAIPLTRLDNGVYRVSGTRVGMDIVIEEFKDGATPEEIVESFDSLQLADIYTIIAYYLGHKEEVEEQLRQEDESAEELRRMIEAKQPPRAEVRARLLARKAQMEAGKNAQAGH
jgi:uncharacterized protein (DUF433 family)